MNEMGDTPLFSEHERAIAQARWDVRTCGDKVRDAAVAHYTECAGVAAIEIAVGNYVEAVNRLKALEENENV